MGRMMKPKGKKSAGCDYVSEDEEYDKKLIKKQGKDMRTAGIANELTLSQKDQGYSTKPRVRAQKKNAKPVMGQKKVY